MASLFGHSVVLLLFGLLFSYSDGDKIASKQPNVVFILADDLGFSDVGYRDPSVLTPRMNGLARSGIILDQAYALPLCTPSRAALLTGRYPFTIGMQHSVLLAGAPYCLPTNLPMLSQALKEAGYSTHIVGKWHLGHCNPACFPTRKGFDSFFGFVNGQEDYYTKEDKEYGNNAPIYDFWDGTNVHFDNSSYSMDLYKQRVNMIVRNHDANQPLFLYLAPSTPHGPIMVPAKYSSLYGHIADLERRTYLGMVSVLDDFVGSVVDALKEARLYDNTIIIFSSDNGGQSVTAIPGIVPEHSGNNYPLRGTKASLYEGGTRVVSFVHSPLLRPRCVVNRNLFHIVDWYPTILDIAGVRYDADKIDGVSQLDALMKMEKSQRREIVYNIDYLGQPVVNSAMLFAIRYDNYKLMMGGSGFRSDEADAWVPPAEFTGVPISGDSCKLHGPNNQTTFACLFDLEGDPYEQRNLYNERPDVVSRIYDRFLFHRRRFAQPLYQQPLPYSDVQLNGVQITGYC